jgi:hypothetical protein
MEGCDGFHNETNSAVDLFLFGIILFGLGNVAFSGCFFAGGRFALLAGLFFPQQVIIKYELVTIAHQRREIGITATDDKAVDVLPGIVIFSFLSEEN